MSQFDGYCISWLASSIVRVKQIQRFSKRFLLYGFSKKALMVDNHNALCSIVLVSFKNIGIKGIALNDIKISHFLECFAILLVYSEKLSDYLYQNDGINLVIKNFSTVIYKYPHLNLCKKCLNFGHTEINCTNNEKKCLKCGGQHSHTTCNVK